MRLIFFYAILIMVTLMGCFGNSKTIFIKDSGGIAIDDCMVLAVESNIFPGNQQGVFYTDHDGKVQIPYHGQILYYAGKPQYKLSFKASVKNQENITIYREAQTLPCNWEVLENRSLQEELSGMRIDPVQKRYFDTAEVIMESQPPKGSKLEKEPTI